MQIQVHERNTSRAYSIHTSTCNTHTHGGFSFVPVSEMDPPTETKISFPISNLSETMVMGSGYLQIRISRDPDFRIYIYTVFVFVAK